MKWRASPSSAGSFVTKGFSRLLILTLILSAAVWLLSKKPRTQTANSLTIGAPDDSGGLVVDYIVRKRMFKAGSVVSKWEKYPIKDCCTSSSEWALSTDALDMAVMCPDSAQGLIEKNPRFRVIGPCVLNSDVLVVRPGVDAAKIGITQKRHYQEKLVEERFRGACTICPMLSAGLPYAYVRSIVDGIVVDVLKAFSVDGKRLSAREGKDLVTYVLVLRKGFENSPVYKRFMAAWAVALIELGDVAALKGEIEAYKGVRWTDRELEEWKRLGVRFVLPGRAENCPKKESSWVPGEKRSFLD